MKNHLTGLLMLTILLACLTGIGSAGTCDPTTGPAERYCQLNASTGNYEFNTYDEGATRQAFMQVDTKIDFVLFEGSIQLVQKGILWVEVTKDTTLQQKVKSGEDSVEVMRIREAYALSNPNN